MKILSPSVARLEKPTWFCAEILNHLGCQSIHLDIGLGLRLPGFLSDAFLMSGELEQFNCSATIHFFTDHGIASFDLTGVRRIDRAMLHVFPNTSMKQISSFLESAVKVGCEPAVALDINTDINTANPFIGVLSVIYIMGIPVATHGQPPNDMTQNRLGVMRETLNSQHSACCLGIDGGINSNTFAHIAPLADEIVIGGLLFDSPNIYSQWKALNAWLKKIDGGAA